MLQGERRLNTSSFFLKCHCVIGHLYRFVFQRINLFSSCQSQFTVNKKHNEKLKLYKYKKPRTKNVRI